MRAVRHNPAGVFQRVLRDLQAQPKRARRPRNTTSSSSPPANACRWACRPAGRHGAAPRAASSVPQPPRPRAAPDHARWSDHWSPAAAWSDPAAARPQRSGRRWWRGQNTGCMGRLLQAQTRTTRSTDAPYAALAFGQHRQQRASVTHAGTATVTPQRYEGLRQQPMAVGSICPAPGAQRCQQAFGGDADGDGAGGDEHIGLRQPAIRRVRAALPWNSISSGLSTEVSALQHMKGCPQPTQLTQVGQEGPPPAPRGRWGDVLQRDQRPRPRAPGALAISHRATGVFDRH